MKKFYFFLFFILFFFFPSSVYANDLPIPISRDYTCTADVFPIAPSSTTVDTLVTSYRIFVGDSTSVVNVNNGYQLFANGFSISTSLPSSVIVYQLEGNRVLSPAYLYIYNPTGAFYISSSSIVSNGTVMYPVVFYENVSGYRLPVVSVSDGFHYYIANFSSDNGAIYNAINNSGFIAPYVNINNFIFFNTGIYPNKFLSLCSSSSSLTYLGGYSFIFSGNKDYPFDTRFYCVFRSNEILPQALNTPAYINFSVSYSEFDRYYYYGNSSINDFLNNDSYAPTGSSDLNNSFSNYESAESNVNGFTSSYLTSFEPLSFLEFLSALPEVATVGVMFTNFWNSLGFLRYIVEFGFLLSLLMLIIGHLKYHKDAPSDANGS